MDIKHKILIVDDEKSVGRSIGRLMELENLDHMFVESAEKALVMLRETNRPFSLIISDQRMPGMKGTQFLEKAKEFSPDSIRFLLTAYSDMETIVASINKGSVHKYINKPWDNDELRLLVRDALKRFETELERQVLLAEAKSQNKKLFQFDKDLKTLTERYEQDLADLKTAIEGFQTGEENHSDTSGADHENIIHKLEMLFVEQEQLNTERLSAFYSEIMNHLYSEFETLANCNGFEMPEI